MALQDHGYLFLAIGAIMLGLLFRAYVATTLDSFPRELSLIREKPNSKHFSIKTRLAFYLHCSSLYRDIWDKRAGKREAFNDMFQLGHSLGDEKYMLDTWAVDVERHVLTKDLDTFIEPVWEEIQLAVDSLLGMDTENWQTVDLLDTMRMIMNRAGSRFVVGIPLCRDEGYLAAAVTSIESIVVKY